MVPCPKCGKNNTKPLRVLENVFFKIEAYQCEGCGKRFEAIS